MFSFLQIKYRAIKILLRSLDNVSQALLHCGHGKRFCGWWGYLRLTPPIPCLMLYPLQLPLLNVVKAKALVTSHVIASGIRKNRMATPEEKLTMGWTVRDRIPVGMRSSARPDWPRGPPSLL